MATESFKKSAGISLLSGYRKSMKIKFYILPALLVLPLTLYFSVSHLKQFQGPYFYGTNSDPDYVYLINSLNIARLKLPGHIDHPGTPVQVIGAITLRFTHLTSGKGKIVNDVLTRPEIYLQTLNAVFLWLNVIILFISGWLVWQVSKKLEVAVLFQLAPFLTIIPEQLIKVSTEPTLVIASILFSVLVYHVFAKEDIEEQKNTYLISFALLSAFGMATKITFFPLLIIPFFLFKHWIDKLYFLLLFILSFFILAFPLLFQWEYFRDWIKGLFFGTGVYGGGKQTVIDPIIFFENLIKIISTELAFDLIFVCALTFLAGFFLYNPLIKYRQSHSIRFQIIKLSVIIISIYLVIIAKHYHYRYMIPPIIFSLMALQGIFLVIHEVFAKTKYRRLIHIGFFSLFIGIIISNQFSSFRETKRMLKYHFTEQNELLTLINNKYPSGIKIYSYGSSCQEQAFSLALGYSHLERSTYLSVLKGLYPNCYFFSFIDKTFYQWTPGNYINIEKILKGKSEVYLHISNLANKGLALDNKLPVLDLKSSKPTGKFLYLKNLNKEDGYRETIYKLEKIGE